MVAERVLSRTPLSGLGEVGAVHVSPPGEVARVVCGLGEARPGLASEVIEQWSPRPMEAREVVWVGLPLARHAGPSGRPVVDLSRTLARTGERR